MNDGNRVSTPFGSAKWLWVRDADANELDQRVQARRSWLLAEVPESAEIKITADALYVLYVNGQYVTRGPARGLHGSWPFDRVEIKSYLRVGKNTLAALIYQPGISNYSYQHNWGMGLLVAGKIGTERIDTGPGWKMRVALGYSRAVARFSRQLGFAEFCDLRTSQIHLWKEVDFDDHDWDQDSALISRAAGSMPWHDFEERAIPLLTSDLMFPDKLLAISKWPGAENSVLPQSLVALYATEKRQWKPSSGSAATITFAGPRTGNEAEGVLIDFGKEVVGTPIIKVAGAAGGECLDLLVCETITGIVPDLPHPTSTNSLQSFGNRVVLGPGDNQHEFLMPLGFRYLALLCRGRTTPLTVDLALRQTLYPLEKTGTFRSSNSILQRIWEMSEHTQRCCMMDAYVDCPWREQAQWWGDAIVQARNTFALADDSRLLARGIRMIGQRQTPNGLTYAMAPSNQLTILPDYSLVWILSHWTYYWQTGKSDLFESMQAQVSGILDYFQKRTGRTGLVDYDDRYWLFLDWCEALNHEGTPTLLNLQYLWALNTAEKLFSLIGSVTKAADCHSRAQTLRQAIAAHLYDKEAGRIWDGLTSAGTLIRKQSPHVAALAIILDIFPEAHERLLENTLLPLVNGDRNDEILPSSFFMYYIFEALKQKGYRREIIDCISRWWGEWVRDGLSTTPENWSWKKNRGSWSLCHGWSAHPLVHFSEILLGIRQEAPGWSKVSFDPLQIEGLYVAGSVPTPHGIIRVSINTTGRRPDLQLDLPTTIERRMSAEALLSGSSPESMDKLKVV